MYRINEVFLSVQGEGPAAGAPALFVRMAGCNLSCPFCDTNHDPSVGLEAEELLAKLYELHPLGGPRLPVVVTGGEPLLQFDQELLEALQVDGYVVHVETNAMEDTAARARQRDPGRLLKACDVVVASPKGPQWSRELVSSASALKVLWPLPGGLRLEDIKEMAEHVGLDREWSGQEGLFLQPVTPFLYDVSDKGTQVAFRANCLGAKAAAIELARSGQAWRVVPQTHVWMGLQ